MGSITVASRAHRILKNLAGFKPQDGFPRDLKDRQNGEMIGIYESKEGQPVAVTSEGLYLKVDSHWRFLGYNQIQEPDTPIEKPYVDGFNLILADGSKVWLPISGVKNNRFYDAFEFIRFIDRVIADLRRG